MDNIKEEGYYDQDVQDTQNGKICENSDEILLRDRMLLVKRMVDSLEEHHKIKLDREIKELESYMNNGKIIESENEINILIDMLSEAYKFFKYEIKLIHKPMIKKNGNHYIVDNLYLYDIYKKMIVGKIDKFESYFKPTIPSDDLKKNKLLPLSFIDREKLTIYKLKFQDI